VTPELVVDIGPLCAPPGVATISASVAAGLVRLQWSAPAGTGTTTYRIGAGRQPGALDVGIASMGTATSVAVPAPSGVYYLRAVGSNACGDGGISPEITVVVP
jgi:hypothetical protein